MFSSSHSHETAITQYTGHVLPPSLESAVSISRGDSAISLPSLNVSRSCHDKKASSASVDVCPAPPLKSAPAPDSMSSHVGLPQNMIWLKDTVVEILIDQEGFRSITPTFRFAGYSTNTRSLDTTEKLVGGAAQFVPIVRQTFNFHYAPFDGQPVLRRISVNGTSRDHVSRQATMCLKSNGVYTVRGSETLLVPSNELQVDENYSIQPSPDAPKLHWKFDYFVDDRRSSGKIEGEKTFTPLTFSCSPLLLHPLQGKKIRLMHVMKKNVVTKLVAEKMELPKTTSCRSPPPSLPVPNSPPLARINPSKAHIWSLHRRLQSHGHSIGHGRSESSDIRGSSLCATNQMRSSNQPTEMRKHRRASSAGDIGATFTGHAIQNVPDRTDEGVAHKVNPLYNRHILPPSKLSELLDNNENAKPKVESLIGLSPAPRNHYNARPGRLL
ncbi:hypothetical protein FB446DRAFT_684992 [Lentinula raphanica]|nr:hypothetical protein FB446DRAFT_684992 [Lentinula raphanica]